MRKSVFYVCLVCAYSFLIPSGVRAIDRNVAAPVNAKNINYSISVAEPGDTVIVPDGVYRNLGQISIPPGVNGTKDRPITLRAESPGGAIITGTYAGSYQIYVEGDYWIIKDFNFESLSQTGDTATKTIYLNGSIGTRITNNRFFDIGNYSTGLCWNIYYGPQTASPNGRVDYNNFDSLNCKGVVINKNSPNGRIDHNYFKDFVGTNSNSAIHLGGSNGTGTELNTVVEYNVFENMNADPETISNKSSGNIYRHNVFDGTGSGGNGIVLRGGNDCVVESNYFFEVGKTNQNNVLRIHGAGHKIFNNYFEGTKGASAILVAAGKTNYEQPVDIEIVNNTIIDSETYSVWIGFWPDSKTPPQNLIFKNNLISQSSGKLVVDTGHTGIFEWKNNLFYNQRKAEYWMNNGGGDEPLSGIVHKYPGLFQDIYVQRIQETSTNIIDKGSKDISFTKDIEGKLRDDLPDIGAYEYTVSGAKGKPISVSEVGVNWEKQYALSPPFNLKVMVGP